MTDFSAAIREVQKGSIAPLYVLKGNDGFLQDFFINTVEESLKKIGTYEKRILSVADSGGPEILAWLTSVDMFVPTKFSVFRDPQLLKGNARKEFVEYIKRPSENNYMIIVNPGDQRPTAMHRELEKSGETVNVYTPKERGLRQWLNYIAKEQNLDLAPEVKEHFLNLAGDSLSHLNNELEKLGLLLGNQGLVTLDSIRGFSTWQRSFDQDDFLLAIGSRDIQKSLLTGERLLAQSGSMITLVFPLFQLFQEFLYIKMTKPGTFNSRRGFIPLSGVVRRQLSKFATAYQFDELSGAIRQLHEIDRRNKQSQRSAHAELFQFIARVVGKGS